MSSAGGIIERLKDIDFKRSLAHVFPGFLLYVGLIMASDAFLSHDQVLTETFFNPTTNTDLLVALILVGLFVGSILGVMIDGIAHWVFEERWFNKIVKALKLSDKDHTTIGDAEDQVFRNWMISHGIHQHEYALHKIVWDTSPEYLYPFTHAGDEDKVNLRDYLIQEFYSYFEFYLNSALSLVFIGFIIPFYSVAFLGASFWVALIVCAVFLVSSMLLMFAAIHTLADYKRARIESIEGFLRKKKNQPRQEDAPNNERRRGQ
jgi:hypothetical protein